jgi:hypothetical protein
MYHVPAHKNRVHPGHCFTPSYPPAEPVVECDFRYTCAGENLIILRPVTARASLWIAEYPGLENAARWGRRGVAVHPRDFADIIDAIDADGLYFAPEGY